jgi:hypothetical protein
MGVAVYEWPGVDVERHVDKQREELAEESGERRVFFKTAFVFDVSQTEIRAGAEPAALEPPRELLTGDSHANLLAPLRAFAGATHR